MKRLLLVVSLLSTYFAPAQQVNQCGIIIPPKRLSSSFSSVYEASQYVNTMLDSINWKENFLLREQKIP